MNEMLKIPNVITASRVLFSIALLFVKPLGMLFYLLYLLCGASDIVDGYIARKTKTESGFGAKLDSFADLVMTAVVIYVIYPIINPSFFIMYWIILIAIIRGLSILISMRKHKTYASIHTYGNKATGVVLFLLPMLLPFANIGLLINFVCAFASVTAFEELVIQLSSKKLDLNRKSLFIK